MGRGSGRARDCPGGREGRSTWIPVFFAALAVMLMVLPAAAAEMPAGHSTTGPQQVRLGVYVVDLNTFNVADGSFGVNFYLALKSDAPVSITDLEIVNGRITSIDTILNNSDEKSYRIFADMTADPDLRQYPFDQHTLLIQIEPKLYDENGMILAIHKNSTGHEPDAGIQGWRLADENSRIISRSYDAGETPYSRAVFSYEIQRDITSTILKFFIPIMLLVIVTLFSLMMKGPSRLGLNASMLIVAVFIHWRISDAIPLVAYATFLDMFMIITYLTIVLVLVSGILIQKYTESGDHARVEQIRHGSILLIPPLSILMYLLLFITLLH